MTDEVTEVGIDWIIKGCVCLKGPLPPPTHANRSWVLNRAMMLMCCILKVDFEENRF